MKSNFLRPFRFNCWIFTKQYHQESYRDQNVAKIPNSTPKNGTFYPMISWVYNNHYVILILHLGIFISKTQGNKFAKKKVSFGNFTIYRKAKFWWPLFDSNFSRVNVIFVWNQLYYQSNSLHLFWMRWAKHFAIIIWKFSIHERNTFARSAISYSHSTLFNKSFS